MPAVNPSTPDEQKEQDAAPRTRAWGPWFAKAAFESLMILFSILAAFAIDNWREDAERARRLAEARGSLTQELRFNLKLLADKAYLPHHERLQGIYRKMLDSGTTDRADAVFEGGIHPTPLRDAAWRSFLVSGVAGDLPFALHARLAGIYGAQERLDFMHRATVAALLAPRADRETPSFTRDMIRTVSMYLTDVVASEEGLRDEYQAAVRELEAAAASR
jgi:hypothetical protein